MRVLIVHNRYQLTAGEDAVVTNEQDLLQEYGCPTRLWEVDNCSITGPVRKFAAAARASYSRPARDALTRVIAEFSPEVVHAHNFFPLLSPSIYDACRAMGVAAVQTLHNYRPICAGAFLIRNGRDCEDCIGGSPYHAVLHGCYRGSRFGSLATARMIETHRRRGTWRNKVDRFIALSNFAKSKFIEAGFPEARIEVKPNFVRDCAVPATEERSGALFVGRLSAEKGIATLLRAWNGLSVPLRIVGDGPLREMVERTNNPNIAALGRRPPLEVAEEMARAAFLIVPSEWQEMFPLVIVEAFCQGLPILASRNASMAERIGDGLTGVLFTQNDSADLAAKARWAFQNPQAMQIMGANARRMYEEKYLPSVNVQQLTEIYKRAIAQNRTSVAS